MASSFDRWEKDPFFSAAEEVQESADRYCCSSLLFSFRISYAVFCILDIEKVLERRNVVVALTFSFYMMRCLCCWLSYKCIPSICYVIILYLLIVVFAGWNQHIELGCTQRKTLRVCGTLRSSTVIFVLPLAPPNGR